MLDWVKSNCGVARLPQPNREQGWVRIRQSNNGWRNNQRFIEILRTSLTGIPAWTVIVLFSVSISKTLSRFAMLIIPSLFKATPFGLSEDPRGRTVWPRSWQSFTIFSTSSTLSGSKKFLFAILTWCVPLQLITSVVSSSGSSWCICSALAVATSVDRTEDSFESESWTLIFSMWLVSTHDTAAPAPIAINAAGSAEEEDHQGLPPSLWDQASFVFWTCDDEDKNRPSLPPSRRSREFLAGCVNLLAGIIVMIFVDSSFECARRFGLICL